MQVVVGRIGRAHGVRGDVAVEVRTDVPDERFAIGSQLQSEPDGKRETGASFVVEAARWHQGRLLVHFRGVDDRDAAEALRGTLLVADSGSSPHAGEEQWWDHDLVGLAAVDQDGARVGELVGVTHPPGNDLLVVRRDDGTEVFVPFVLAIVPDVDLAAGRIVIDAPDGLLEL